MVTNSNHKIVNLNFQQHSELCKIPLSCKLKKRFLKIIKDIIRIMNLQEPVQNKLWFRKYDDHIDLIENHKLFNSKLDVLIVQIGQDTYFAPWIYAFYQLSARVLIYKNNQIVTTENADENSDEIPSVTMDKTFLVHRSHPNGELQHPGGHLRYIERGYRYTPSNGYYLDIAYGIEYVRSIIPKILANKLDDDFISSNINTDIMMSWIVLGASREVLEESGLELDNDRLTLLKTGTKTFYLGFQLDLNIIEPGPMEAFKNEIVNYQSIDLKNVSKFDQFWLERSDKISNHAWLTALEMSEYWNGSYKEHILELIELIEMISVT